MRVEVVHIDKIEVEARFRQDLGDLSKLVASLEDEGIIQSLAVTHGSETGKFRLLAGGRRLEACRQAGLVAIPIRMYDEDLSELQMRSIELAENIFRKDLTYAEDVALKAEIHKLQVTLHEDDVPIGKGAKGHSKRDTAKLLSTSPSALSRDLKLAKVIQMFPELGELKDKSDALKMIKKMGVNIEREELAKQLASTRKRTPIGKARKELCNNYIVSDFFDAIKQIPSSSIDYIDLDPDWAIDIRDSKNMRSSAIDTIGYEEVDPNRFEQFLDGVLKECYRVMRADSWITIWFGPDPWFESVALAIEKAGFYIRRIPAMWLKPKGSNRNPDIHLSRGNELFFYARKGKPTLQKLGRSDVFDFSPISPARKTHPTEKPIELCQEMLETFVKTGSRILVPFLGSGNMLLAGSNLGMSGVGFDLNEDYKNAYVIKVHDSEPGKYRSY